MIDIAPMHKTNTATSIAATRRCGLGVLASRCSAVRPATARRGRGRGRGAARLCTVAGVDELRWIDAVGQAELVRSGEIAPVELVEAACGRVQELNPTLNAVIAPRLERARAEAAERTHGDAAFTGVPFLTKDMGAFTADDPIAFGVRALRELGWRPKRTAPTGGGCAPPASSTSARPTSRSSRSSA